MPATTLAAPAATSRRRAAPARRYTVTDAFLRDALNDAMFESLMSRVSFPEKQEVRLKPNFQTACWAYLPPHRIYVGKDLFEKSIVKLGLGEAVQQRYIASHYHHELAHALYTERDMARVNKALAVIRCPFQLFNVFEDARIEERYRREAEYRFEWLAAEEPVMSPDPVNLLLHIIQHEGDIVTLRKKVSTWKPEGAPDEHAQQAAGDLATRFERVVSYYERILLVNESMHLMPLLKQWVDEFGAPPENKNTDLQLGQSLAADADKREKFDADTEDLNEGKSEELEPDPTDEAKARRGSVLSDESTAVDGARAQALASRLGRLFQSFRTRMSTWAPQKRVSARHMALDRAPYRKPMVKGRASRDIFLVIDCSGSMDGFHMDEGKLLVSALSRLAREGKVTGHVVLSAQMASGSNWELFELPMSESAIARIQARAAGEGLENTMRSNLALMRAADFVFVYTDGQISDKAVNKTFFHEQGVYTWGLYAGDNAGYLEKLCKYFDKAVLRENAEQLVDAMLAQL